MANNIYLSLPAWGQNAALSIYGANLHRQRFQGDVPSVYTSSLNLFSFPTEDMFKLQKFRFQELLTHCKRYVPYYQKYLSRVDPVKVSVGDIKDLVPILSKADVIDHSDRLISQAPFFRNKLRTANTSGSSGTPLCIFYTDESRRINYRFYEAALAQFGCRYKSKSTTFAGRVLYKDPGVNPARYDFYNRTQYLSSYFISPDTIRHYVDALNHWQPEFIDTYPSTIFTLVNLAESQGLKFKFTPKCILTSSETLTGEVRLTVERAFGTTIVDHYGCTEMAINAVSMGGDYVASPLYSLIELEHQFDNSFGVVTTGLLNFGMPLLRYRIGDLVEKATAASDYVLSRIEGRLDDVIITPEGRKVGRMDPAFKGIEGVSSAQIIQETVSLITVLVVLDAKNYARFDSELLVRNIKERTSKSIEVRIQMVDKIEKSANGKFKSVISRLS
jgi:phenylacetate-CoA ligase